MSIECMILLILCIGIVLLRISLLIFSDHCFTFLKKYYIADLLVNALVLCGLIAAISGMIIDIIYTSDKTSIVTEYKNTENIEVNTANSKETLRISIADTYTRDNVKYYVIETDEPEHPQFTLTETEYDKYIGVNDIIDSQVYRLQLDSTICTGKYIYMANDECLEQALEKFLAKHEGMIEKNDPEGYETFVSGDTSWTIHTDFIEENAYFKLNSHCGKNYFSKEYLKDTNVLEVKRYSFLGEKDFTEEDIKQCKELMDEMNVTILNEIKSRSSI